MLRPAASTASHGRAIVDEERSAAPPYLAVYAIIAIVSMLLISLDDMDVETTVSAVLATLNNIGPGFGVVGPAGNYHAYSDFSKIVLSLDMLLGRLELFPMLMMFVPSIWHRGRDRA